MWKNSKAFFSWCNKKNALSHISQVDIKGVPVLLLDNARGGYFGCRIIMADDEKSEHETLSKHYIKRGYHCSIETNFADCKKIIMWYLRFQPTKTTQAKLTNAENKVYQLFKINNRPIYSGDINALAEQNGFEIKNSFAVLHRLVQKGFIRKSDDTIESTNHPEGRGRTPSVFYVDSYPDDVS